MEMKMSFKHIRPSETVKNYATEKSNKLKKYFRGRISVNWNFTSEKQNRIAHCHLVGNRMDYFGEGLTDDLLASIDMALDRIEKQLRKHKEVVKDHLHKNGKRSQASISEAPEDEAEDQPPEEDQAEIQ